MEILGPNNGKTYLRLRLKNIALAKYPNQINLENDVSVLTEELLIHDNYALHCTIFQGTTIIDGKSTHV